MPLTSSEFSRGSSRSPQGLPPRWAENQHLIADRFERSKAARKLGRGTVARAARERASQSGASPTITIRLAEHDLTRAWTLAAERGLRYQNYLLLHQALDSEEKKAGRG
jgi:hypothetical protein